MVRFTSLLAAAAMLLPAAAFAGKTAWVSSNHIQVIDLDTAQVVGRLPLQEFIHDMEFSRDGSSVYVASSKGLRVADADRLEFVQKVDERATMGVAVSADGARVAAIHRVDKDSAQAARVAGLPLPPSTVVVYSTLGMSVETKFEVSGDSLDIAISSDGQTLWILVPQDGAVYAHSSDGALLERIELVDQNKGHGAMLSRLALAPDGSRLIVPVTDAEQSWLADIDLRGARAADERVLRQDLGHARRIQGLSWDDDGSGVYVSAIRSLVKFNGLGLPIAWKQFPLNYVDVEPIPGSDEMVMVTPTFSEERGTGGVSVVTGDGAVLRSIELPDMSPFVVVVQP